MWSRGHFLLDLTASVAELSAAGCRAARPPRRPRRVRRVCAKTSGHHAQKKLQQIADARRALEYMLRTAGATRLCSRCCALDPSPGSGSIDGRPYYAVVSLHTVWRSEKPRGSLPQGAGRRRGGCGRRTPSGCCARWPRCGGAARSPPVAAAAAARFARPRCATAG